MLWEVRLLSFALCENEILTLRLNVLCLLADVVCSYPGGRLRDRENFALLLACFSQISQIDQSFLHGGWAWRKAGRSLCLLFVP
jgi:hypothetical protein